METPQKSPEKVVFPPLIIILYLAAAAFLRKLWPLPVPSLPKALEAVLLLLGGLLVLWSFWTFRRADTPTDPGARATALVTGGPYRFSRNPIYVGFLLGCLGAMIDNPWVLVLLPVAVAALEYFVIRREERRLEGWFGDEYRRYRESVRRWL